MIHSLNDKFRRFWLFLRLLASTSRSVALHSALLFVLCSGLHAQSQAFDKRIRSLECKVPAAKEIRFTPYYYLHSDERLHLSFDILGDESPLLGYRLQHCDMDWRPSPLQAVEYLQGFFENEMEPAKESRATLQAYSHYALSIPHETCSPKLSGNYLLSIYDVYNPDEVLLQVGFRVVESKLPFTSSVTPITVAGNYSQYQQVDLLVDIKDLPLMRPTEDLKPVIVQNGREDNRQTLHKPSRVERSRLIYDLQQGAVFEATNSYRKAEMLSDTYNGMGVYKSYREDGLYVMELYAGKNRAGLPYVYDEDMHGLQVIRSVDGARSANEYEYYRVDFTFLSPVLPGQVLLSGMAFDYLPLSERVMYYDEESQSYWRSLEVKQGYINYLYLLKQNGSRLSASQTEGNHYEARNAYTSFLYLYDTTLQYQSIIGVSELR